MIAGFPSCRHVLTLMGFFVFLNFFALRVSLSVAIIVMVNSTDRHQLDDAATNVSSNYSSGLSDEYKLHSTDDIDNVRILRTPCQNRIGLTHPTGGYRAGHCHALYLQLYSADLFVTSSSTAKTMFSDNLLICMVTSKETLWCNQLNVQVMRIIVRDLIELYQCTGAK